MEVTRGKKGRGKQIGKRGSNIGNKRKLDFREHAIEYIDIEL